MELREGEDFVHSGSSQLVAIVLTVNSTNLYGFGLNSHVNMHLIYTASIVQDSY